MTADDSGAALQDRFLQRALNDVLDALDGVAPRDELAARLRPVINAQIRGLIDEARDRLARAERLTHVGQLSAGVAHELRNPLSVIETSVYLLNQRYGDDPLAERQLKRISAQLDIARETINDVLDATREGALTRCEVDLGAIVREAVGWVPRAPEVTLRLSLPDEAPRVSGDARKLRQVVINIVSNALQAMESRPRPPPLEVTLAAGDDHQRLSVRDTGVGIPPEALPRLFEPLYSTRRDGVGMGLALSRRIIEAHGGTLVAENVPDGGARFTVTLPLGRPA